MSVDVKIPSAGESISEVTIGEWIKSVGDVVQRDDVIVVIESDKASMEIPAPESGTLSEQCFETGAEAAPGDVVAKIDPNGTAGPDEEEPSGDEEGRQADDEEAEREEEDADREEDADENADREEDRAVDPDGHRLEPRLTPAARRALRERGHEPTEEGLLDALGADRGEPQRREEAVPMGPLRRTIAKRLVAAQQDMALVTTFNEIDMGAVMTIRNEHGQRFEEKHGVRLGIMSFFVKATIEALKRYPGLNAEVRGEDIVYKRYYDVGVAVGTERGLVVPVLRNAERSSLADIERQIADFAERANDGKLTPDDLKGGTFTLSNGGVYGSLMSEPIINPPQSGVLGMHAIKKRPVVRDDDIVIRPMMYVALTYDHRVVDGREAVQCLAAIKDGVESPAVMLLEL